MVGSHLPGSGPHTGPCDTGHGWHLFVAAPESRSCPSSLCPLPMILLLMSTSQVSGSLCLIVLPLTEGEEWWSEARPVCCVLVNTSQCAGPCDSVRGSNAPMFLGEGARQSSCVLVRNGVCAECDSEFMCVCLRMVVCEWQELAVSARRCC